VTRAERRQIDPGEHRFALPEHDRGQGEMRFVDQPGAKILTHRLDATPDLHVATLGGELRLLQRRLDTVVHEDEDGAAVHPVRTIQSTPSTNIRLSRQVEPIWSGRPMISGAIRAHACPHRSIPIDPAHPRPPPQKQS